MRRRTQSLLAVPSALAAFCLLSLATASPAAALPLVCQSTPLPPPPAANGGVQDALVRQAAIWVEKGQLESADRLYAFALQSYPSDPRGGEGLAYVDRRRQAAAGAVDEAEALAQSDPDGSAADIKSCYATALEQDPENAAAMKAADAEPSTTTPATDAAKQWDEFFKSWIDPLVRLIVPALVVLAILLVLARALTSSVVRPRARALSDPSRRRAGGFGLALLVAASVCGIRLGAASGPLVESSLGGWIVVVLLLLLVPLLLRGAVHVARWSLDPDQRHPWARWFPAWDVPGKVGASVGGALLAVAVLTGARQAAPWVLTAAVACLGLVLVAVGRGHALRLSVQVRNGKDDDASGTAYVLARLQELGTSPPEGLKTPQQVDVQDLPTEALKSMPAGRVAIALKQLLDLAVPAAPWRAVVQAGDDATRVVVTVTRNASVLRTALVDASLFLPRPSGEAGGSSGEDEKTPSDDDKADPGDLLTAAAAVVLTELSLVHQELQTGLCGASRWESVAAHVVATKPPATPGGSRLRRELLAYAVQADPANALAQLAYANLEGEEVTEAGERCRYAARLRQLVGAIEEQAGVAGGKGSALWDDNKAALKAAVELEVAAAGAAAQAAAHKATWSAVARLVVGEIAASNAGSVADGYLPLRLRARHELTATWLNVAAETHPGPERDSAVDEAAVNYEAMVCLLRLAHVSVRGSDAFIDEMSRVAGALKRAFIPLIRKRVTGPDLPDPPVTGEKVVLASLHVLYDDACRLSLERDYDNAVLTLDRAAGLEGNRRNALTDPWFANIRSAPAATDVVREKAVQRFWEIVGPPAPTFNELPLFRGKGADLSKIGVTGAAELFAATRTDAELADMAKVLKVPVGVVAGWQRLAELARPPEPRSAASRWLTPRQLRILLAADIRSLSDLCLHVPLSGDPSHLRTLLHKEAEDLGVAPLTQAEVDDVAARAR